MNDTSIATEDQLLAELELMAKRREVDKQRPHQCACGHSKQAHDSGFSFCWFCDCDKWQLP